MSDKTLNICNYKHVKNKAPYPRTFWISDCGFQHVQMEGYKFDIDNARTSDIHFPSGKCMKCGNEISALD